MYRRLTATAAVGGALMLTLTGCLGEAEQASRDTGGAIKQAAAQFMAQVSDRTEQADTYTTRSVTNTRMTVASQRVETRTEMRMQVRLKPEPAMKGTVTTTGTAGGQGLPTGRRPIQMIMVGDGLYMNMGSPELSGGKPWAKISVSGASGMGADTLKQAQQYGPAETTRMLTASPDVREVGRETVDGVATTHYAGTVDPAADFGALGPEYRKNLQKAFEGLDVQRIQIEIWVDGDGLPRKQTARTTMKMGTVDVTATFSDFGEPVEITAPPADQVGEFKLPGAPQPPQMTTS